MPPPPAIVLFGELLLRLDADGHERLVQAGRFRARYTGAEANVGVALAGWGWRSVMVSRVPDHDLGHACRQHLQRHGLDLTAVQAGPGRLGILYVEAGAGPRPTRVVYDRAATAFAGFDGAAVDWPAVLRGARWFHFSGTAAALPGMAAVVAAVGATARALGVKVSFDVNFRRALWSREAAAPVFARLAAAADLLICNAEDAAELFGVTGADDAAVARELRARFGLAQVAVTRRVSLSATRSRWSAWLQDGGTGCGSRESELEAVDRIGTGDAFAAGLLHGLTEGWPPERTLAFAAAACALKHTIPGDFALVSVAEIEALAAGDASGRIQR